MGGADSILKGQAYFINRSSRHLGHKLGRSLIAYKWESILGGQANGTYEAWWPCKMFVEHADHGLLVRRPCYTDIPYEYGAVCAIFV